MRVRQQNLLYENGKKISFLCALNRNKRKFMKPHGIDGDHNNFSSNDTSLFDFRSIESWKLPKIIQIYFSAIPTEPAGEVKPRKFSIWKLFNSSILSVLSANAKTRQFDKLKDHFVKQIGKILLHFSSRIGREQTTKSQSAYSGASFCRKSSFHKLSTRSARRLDRSFSFC